MNKKTKKDLLIKSIQEFFRKPVVATVCIIAAIAAALFLPKVTSLYTQRIFVMVWFYMTLGLSLNFITGYLGEVSLGHASFYAIGGYATALLTTDGGWSYWPAVLAAVLLCGMFGMLLSFATMRVFGTYLCILTLAFFYLTMNIIQNWESVTHGTLGVYNIPQARIFGFQFSIKNGGYYYAAFAYVLLSILITALLMNSRFGRAMKAVREDTMAAAMTGINIQAYRLLGYVIAAMLAGLAGSLYSPFMGFIDHTTFYYDMCLITLVIVISGGRGTILGVVVGALIISPLGELLRQLTTVTKNLPFHFIEDPEKWRFVIYGLILILMMRLRPQGLLGGKSKADYRMPKGIEGQKK